MRKLALSDEILLNIEKPARYIGNEVNMVVKDPESVDIRYAMCFPDVYDIGMSHLGIQIIYDLLNKRDDVYCERVYSPWVDLDKIMREKNIPLFALESQDSVKDFDFIGITLQYEMCYTNILQLLDLSQVTLLSKDRGEDEPIVMGGGPCSYNPEPVADFFDIFYMGEGETEFYHLLDLYKENKKNGGTRKEFLEMAAEIPCMYVPAFYDVIYNEDCTIKEMVPNNPHAKGGVRKDIVLDFDKVEYPEKPLVPFIKVTQDRCVLEVQRGCIRECRFCQAGSVYKPLREKSLEKLKYLATTMLKTTGQEEISLSSLSTSDYSHLKELIDFLIEECKSRHINISLPSLRIDAFSLDVMSKVQDVKKSSITFAPEAGTQRMRNVINKGLTEEDILNGCEQAFKGGWNKVKLYFMLGQPTETNDDVDGIMDLCEKIAELYYETVPKEKRNGKCQITASTSFFVPKPFTPFQWAPMCTSKDFLDKARRINDKLKTLLNRKSIKYHWHESDISVLEGLLARGDRKLAKTILYVYEKGGIYDAWSEFHNEELWQEAIKETNIDVDFYVTRERKEDEIFPWDFIDTGVTKNFLLREWHNAHNETVTPNCRMKCSGCGAASFGGGICHEN
ncbi:TIGR03960 family B12-binding radical SAM protein [Eubacterium sp. AF15-50]|uniref:TIGR03960 family B12-binding radical SAM protein n=1 Tax=Eubacterium segne TaxID=2763045 RepID=A0ABR7F398_9FIRM|nr:MULTISPECIES: TIGR03960 family B12-binding radical SAM protein [Eubacterium]MBC5668057.1 TIGR03960 family B12-binding radical SAM protein [Eubacterium segne]RHR74376.1 TIGR03960 family B12-binding radical SAM protein [Eubacterium sp. AF16-48]RHR81910.1 TIGR03960 family B12-binding radical SAM protein [Eubacterium sp. AF15-50]